MYPEKFIWDNVAAAFVQLSFLIVTLRKNVHSKSVSKTAIFSKIGSKYYI